MTDTFDRLTAILIRDYKLSAEQLAPDAALESLGIDSLGTVELLWSVEDAFGIKLPGEPVPLTTLGEVVAYVDGLIAEQSASPTATEDLDTDRDTANAIETPRATVEAAGGSAANASVQGAVPISDPAPSSTSP